MRFMETLLVNLGKAVPQKLGGRDYLVAPLTLIVPGVLSGSQGPIYYPEDEVERWPGLWNHVPLVVYHPIHDGQHVTARDPAVLDKSGVGLVLRDTYAENRRSAEAWFEVEATKRVDRTLAPAYRILPRLLSGKPIEISTGLDLDKEPAPEGAAYNGQGYSSIARNFRPDHLAILPDAKGACSNKDGCGVNVNEGGGQSTPNSLFDGFLKNLELEFGALNCGGEGGTPGPCAVGGAPKPHAETRTEADQKYSKDPHHKAMVEKFGKEVADAVMAKVSAKKNFSRDDVAKELKKMGKIKSTLTSPYLDSNKVSNFEGEPMKRSEMIQYLTANCDCWKGKEDKALLEKFDDAKLTKLVGNTKVILVVNQIKNKKDRNAEGGDEAVAGVPWTELATLLGVDLNPADDPIEFAAALKAKVDEISTKLGGAPSPEVIPDEVIMAASEEEPVAMAGTQEVEKTTANRRERQVAPRKPQTEAEWLASAPPAVRSAVTNAMALEKQAKTKLVQRLVGNIVSAPQRQAMGAKLMLKTLGELQDLASLIPEAPAGQAQEVPNFAFAGGAGGDVGMLGNAGEVDDSDNVLPVFAVNFDEMASPKLRQKKTA